MYGQGLQIVPVSCADVKSSPHDYNSSSHPVGEAPDLAIPSEEPVEFRHWARLYANMGEYDTSDIQNTFMSAKQCNLFLKATANTVYTGIIGLDYQRLVASEIFPIFRRITFPTEGLSVRLNRCTTIDGDKGNCAVINATETVIRLGSSKKSRASIEQALEMTGMAGGILVYFTPFHTALLSDHRYRVFCAPGCGRMTAISQFNWDTKSALSFGWKKGNGLSFGVAINLILSIYGDIRDIHNAIIDADVDNGALRVLVMQGFTFDVVWSMEDEICTLIEINTFGVRSSIGSCLFHWVQDMNLLYAKEERWKDINNNVEFRIALDPLDQAPDVKSEMPTRIVPRSRSSASSDTPARHSIE